MAEATWAMGDPASIRWQSSSRPWAVRGALGCDTRTSGGCAGFDTCTPTTGGPRLRGSSLRYQRLWREHLGLELDGEAVVEGPWVDRVIGLDDV